MKRTLIVAAVLIFAKWPIASHSGQMLPVTALCQQVGRPQALPDQHVKTESRGSESSRQLTWASDRGDIEMVKRLVSQGADINPKDLFHGQTPLTQAAAMGRLDVVTFLIEHGAQVNANSTKSGHSYYLINEGVGPDHPTPLGSAAQGGQTAVIEYLLHKGAKINAQDGSSYTPLMWACEVGHIATVKALLRDGAEVNVKTDRGQTAASMMRAHIAAGVQATEYSEILALLDAVRPAPRKGGRDRGKEQHTGTNL